MQLDLSSTARKPVLLLLKQYLTLCKIRVVILMLLTALVGMLLALPKSNSVTLTTFILSLLGIGLTASAGAAFNHLAEQHIDAKMSRTKFRPLPAGLISPLHAFIFASLLLTMGMLLLLLYVNTLTALLTFLTFSGYAGIYTLVLKRLTPQNIVIGGLSGAMPPLLGWTAMTNHLDANAWLLVLIIFVWTPPHFWALAIAKIEDYKKSNIPMLPVTHGLRFTQFNILLYSILLFVCTLLPFVSGLFSWFYLGSVIILNLVNLSLAIKLWLAPNKPLAHRLFRFSIIYLALIFVFMLIDHIL